MSSVSYRHFTGTAAENYQRDFVPAIATPVSRDLLRAADLRPGERVLDVACGTGVISRLAALRVGLGGTVTAIDIAPDMIDVAKAVAGPDGAKIDWRTADAESLPLPDASVDVVLCQMGLMFMENRSAAIAEMRRVLSPTGRVVVSQHAGPDPTGLRASRAGNRRAHQSRPWRLRERRILHARPRQGRRVAA